MKITPFIFSLSNVVNNANNGYRAVFEKQLNNKRFLVIFRTPDVGAFGGDNILPAIVQRIIPGIEKRKFLQEKMIIFDANSDSNYVNIDGCKINIPKENILRNYKFLRKQNE